MSFPPRCLDWTASRWISAVGSQLDSVSAGRLVRAAGGTPRHPTPQRPRRRSASRLTCFDPMALRPRPHRSGPATAGALPARPLGRQPTIDSRRLRSRSSEKDTAGCRWERWRTPGVEVGVTPKTETAVRVVDRYAVNDQPCVAGQAVVGAVVDVDVAGELRLGPPPTQWHR